MEKLIIENRTNLKMSEALDYAKKVILQGRISDSYKGKQYCYCTRFEKSKIVVYSDMNIKSDKLTICPDLGASMEQN